MSDSDTKAKTGRHEEYETDVSSALLEEVLAELYGFSREGEIAERVALRIIRVVRETH